MNLSLFDPTTIDLPTHERIPAHRHHHAKKARTDTQTRRALRQLAKEGIVLVPIATHLD